MKTLGIVGGLGPESTVDYYRAFVAGYRARVGDGSYPHLLLVSVDLQRVRDDVTRREYAKVTAHLVAALESLARAGADIALISANTPHVVFDEVAARSPLPLISIVEAACAAAKAAGKQRLALFGTNFTMRGRFYPEVFERNAVGLVLPKTDEQDWIHEKYMNELLEGVVLPETREGLLAIADRLREEDEVDGVLLAGTELSLILGPEHERGVPFLDTAKIHVEAALDAVLGGGR